MTPSSESTRELVLRMHGELLRTRDPDGVEDFFAHDFVSHNMPPGFPPGVEGVKRFFGMFREALSDLDVTLDEIVAEGDRVVIATTTTGTHTGDLLGITPTGRRVAVTGIDLVRIEDGKIVEHRGLTDTVGLLRQLSG
jgi:predicted ester cyclase